MSANARTKLACWLAVTATLASVLTASSLRAAPVPEAGVVGLALVPAQAPIVVHLRGVERTKERLTTLLKKVEPDLGPAVAAQIDELLRTGFDGRKLQGLVEDGSVFLALLELPDPNMDVPAGALIARVTRYTEFRDGLLTEDERKNLKPDPAGFEHTQINGQDAYFVDRKDYAILTPSKDVAALIARKPDGLAGKLDAEIIRGLIGSDLGVYVNLATVNRTYGEYIQAGRDFLQAMVDVMPAGAAERASLEMIQNVYGGLLQVIEDGQALVLALDFRPEGFNVRLQAQVGADTKTNQLLKEMKPAALTEIGSLPPGHVVYTAARYSPALFQAMAPMVYGLIGGEGEAQKKIEAAIEQFVAAGATTSLSAANVPPEGIEVVTYQDAAKAAAAQLQLFRAIGEGGTFQGAYLKGAPDIQENAQDYKGFKLHGVAMTWDLDKFAEALPAGGDEVKKAMQKMLGEGLKIWFGTDGRRYLAVTAKDWAAAQAKIDAYLGGQTTLAQDAAFQATRQQLPAEATVYYLIDAGKYTAIMVDYMLAMFQAMPGLPIPLPNEVKPVKTEVSYVGAAVTLKPEHGSLDLFVPATAVLEVRKVLLPLFQGGAN